MFFRCWCGEAGVDYDSHGASDAQYCDLPCAGDAKGGDATWRTCGGYNSFQLYIYEALEQPEGHLGCFADDKRTRIFPDTRTYNNDLTPQVRWFGWGCSACVVPCRIGSCGAHESWRCCSAVYTLVLRRPSSFVAVVLLVFGAF